GERKRVANELHEGLGNRLAALKLNIGARHLQLLRTGEQGDAADTLCSVAEEMKEMIKEVREISHGLHPEKLMEYGFLHIMRKLVADWQEQFEKGIEFIKPVSE